MNFKSLYEKALLEDERLSRALVGAYGRKASQMRYRTDIQHPTAVVEALQRKIEADEALHEAWQRQTIPLNYK